ncbi:MAG: hypothetical protein V1674_02190 [Candidatus Omnitrophota bacterium]
MAEETPPQDAKKGMVTAFKYLFGIVLIVLGGVLVYRWWPDLVTVFKGCFGLFLVLAGIIAVAIAKE